ncbi:MAG TPA: hypothetical protein PLF40_09090 [Kofleriaceae bacterium]|nr:hypothetical protein [Kofleriaceae bacterium]
MNIAHRLNWWITRLATVAVAVIAMAHAATPAHACAVNSQCNKSLERQQRFWLADVGLHVVNVGFGMSLATRTGPLPTVLQVSVGLYGAWTQTGNVFGVSGDAADINATGAVARVRLVHYFGRDLAGVSVSAFAQAGAARIRDEKAVPDGAHVGAIGSIGATLGYGWWLSDESRWHLAVGAGVQAHVAGGNPGFARLYPQLDAIVSYRM